MFKSINQLTVLTNGGLTVILLQVAKFKRVIKSSNSTKKFGILQIPIIKSSQFRSLA